MPFGEHSVHACSNCSTSMVVLHVTLISKATGALCDFQYLLQKGWVPLGGSPDQWIIPNEQLLIVVATQSGKGRVPLGKIQIHVCSNYFVFS